MVLLLFTETVQVFPLVLSHPDQLVSLEPLPGVAVRVTVLEAGLLSARKISEQSSPQLIPVPATVPLPSPDF
jgi:hypothetical protein